MRFQFDPNQPHQLRAIDAVCRVLDGQVRRPPSAGSPQRLDLTPSTLLANIQRVQRARGLPISETYLGPELSVEMETGTGKTYAYLRTIRALHDTFGYERFVVVVPTIAIREGVLQQSRVLAPHLEALYPRARVTTRLYRPNHLAELRLFSEAANVQVLVINIDAFNKTKHNLIHRPMDALSGHSPLELISRCRPVVILDEPQNMGSPKAKAAIASLAPLMTLRYSATHRELYHRVERLSPVEAYDQGLVKRIEVVSIHRDGVERPPQLRVLQVRASSRTVSAKLAVEKAGPHGPIPVTLTVRGEGEDLAALTGRGVYTGFVVNEVVASNRTVRFDNGVELREGMDLAGPLSADEMKAQIYETVRLHLEHERHIHDALPQARRMKVLSLFFVDRVARFEDPEGQPGVAQRWFRDAYCDLSARPEFQALCLPNVDEVLVSYFAQQRGRPVDTSGVTRDDDRSYALIMRDKARLLDPSEPARFIFSHSALREGWDNPNVFQICTLHRTRSDLRKRQEIGRGLRLPVMVNGERCDDAEFTRLVVVANDTYEAFAERLQREVLEESGTAFNDRIVNHTEMAAAVLRDGAMTEAAFRGLWAKVGRTLRWSTTVDTDALVDVVTDRALSRETTAPLRFRHTRVETHEGAWSVRELSSSQAEGASEPAPRCPPTFDPVAALQHDTGLTRRTLVRILEQTGLANALFTDAEAVVHWVSEQIAEYIARCQDADGDLETVGEPLDPGLLKARPPRGRKVDMVTLDCGPYRLVPVKSGRRRDHLFQALRQPGVRCAMPWPAWLRPQFAGASHDPGWALMREVNGELRPELWPLLDRSVDFEMRSWYTLLADAVGLTVRWK